MKHGLKLCVFTGTRSEYDRLSCLLRFLENDDEVELQLVAAHMHLSPVHGYTIERIRADGFEPAAEVEMLVSSDSAVGISKSIGIGTLELAELFCRLEPDMVLILGDRAELLAVAIVCVCQHIPLLHLCGGELTEGAIDDQVRHMITKAAHLHFVAHKSFARRVQQLGEESWRIVVTGSPSLDLIGEMKIIDRSTLSRDLGIDLAQPTAIVAYHPATQHPDEVRKSAEQLIAALGEHEFQYVVTYPNADAGSAEIIDVLNEFVGAAPKRRKIFRSLGGRRFLSLMKHAVMIIGNSSSGIVEAPSFALPAVNIGDRQAGRILSQNVIQADVKRTAISTAIQAAKGYTSESIENPYGDMKASPRIVKQLKSLLRRKTRNDLLHKRFVDLEFDI